MGSHNPPPFKAQRPRWHLFLSPIDVGPYQIYPLWALASSCLPPLRGTASLLTHSPVSGFDTICNGPSSPLADIVLVEFSKLPLRFLNASARGRFPHSCGSLSSPTDVRFHSHCDPSVRQKSYESRRCSHIFVIELYWTSNCGRN